MPGYTCGSCGEWHDELPLAYGTDAPDYWSPQLEDDERSELGEEQCVLAGEHFFVRGRIAIPLLDHDEDFEWGVWVSLSEESFKRMSELWSTPGREREPSYFGWLSTELPVYTPATLNLKTRVHTEPVGVRPLVELEPTDHPLAVQQRTGITLADVQCFAELLLHPG